MRSAAWRSTSRACARGQSPRTARPVAVAGGDQDGRVPGAAGDSAARCCSRCPWCSRCPYGRRVALMSWRAGLAALLAVSTLLVAPARPARAHAHLVQAVPPGDAVLGTAPARIDLVFDEELDGEKSRLRVYDASGSRVDRNDLQVVARRMTIGVRNLTPGSYRVSWL